MVARLSITLVFVVNTFVSGLCMMPMAMAVEMPDHDMGITKEIMTPMSQSDYSYHDHAEKEVQFETSTKDTSCNGENCLSPSLIKTEILTSGFSLHSDIPVTSFSTPQEELPRPSHAPPPHTTMLTQTVVLLF